MAISDFQNFEFLTPKFAKMKTFMKKLHKIENFKISKKRSICFTCVLNL